MTRIVVRALSMAAIVCAAAAPAVAQGPAISAELAIATFDTAWARIDRTYYDTTFLNTRWKVLRDSLRPIAQQAKTNAELRVVLQRLIAGVGVSHFGLIPQEMAPALSGATVAPASGTAPGGTKRPTVPGGALASSGSAGASLRMAGTDLVVWKADSAGAAWKAGVRPGDVVQRIDDLDVTTAFAQFASISDHSVARQARVTAVSHANAALAGTVGDTVVLGVKSGSVTRTVSIVLAPVRGQMTRFGNLPALNAVLDVSERTVAGPSGVRHIGVIAFSVWLPVLSSGLDSAFDRLRGTDGIVIDLRGNPGGVAGMVSLVSGQLLDSSYVLGTLRTKGSTLHLSANPRANVFAGPVVVLMDRLSASTSEFFAAGLQAIGRARVVGDTSAGAALPAILDRLPNGDVMMHALADLADAKGRRVEGVGVIPDDVVPLSTASLAAGRDDAMAAALKWAAAQPRTHKD